MTPLRPLLGLLLTGYGLLVLVRVLAHDAILAGLVSLLLGVALLLPGLPGLGLRRAKAVAALGALLSVGVLGYNLATRSGLSAPEWAILAYGVLLCAASAFLSKNVGRVPLSSIVGWSFPVVLAPLGLFAANGVVSSPQTGAAASPIVLALIVRPTALGLTLLGTPVQVVGTNMILQTARGSLTLDVGLVCAGLYPMLLFGSIVALHAWRERLSARQALTLVGAGLAGLWILNLVRLVVLVRVGEHWGASALQTVHAHLGWALFGVFMIAFWAVALRRPDPGRRAPGETLPTPAEMA